MENSDEAPETKQPQIEEEPKTKLWWQNQWNKRWVKWTTLAIGVLIVVFGVAIISSSKEADQTDFFSSSEEQNSSDSQAVRDGKRLTNNQCEGEGVPYKLSESPMKPDEFSTIVPYGLMVGAHVTPIDHQYFNPISYESGIDAYEVRAMADSNIVEITRRPRPFGQEYRMVFTISCTFIYYYDLVTSITPDIQQAWDDAKASRESLKIPVKAGQLIGRIGGQTLDFAVWDTTKPLSGFVVPEHYQSEPWKQFTADPLDYYTDELKEFILTRYERSAPPISGKIDYDIDGRLIGNWFLEGSDGYAGANTTVDGSYWSTHLSFSPDHYVPEWFVISIGDYKLEPGMDPGSQFMSEKNSPNPKDVSVETGLVKYDLTRWNYYDESGELWERSSVVKGLNIITNTQENMRACALVQMVKTRKLNFEVFKGQKCTTVTNFSAAVKVYTR